MTIINQLKKYANANLVEAARLGNAHLFDDITNPYYTKDYKRLNEAFATLGRNPDKNIRDGWKKAINNRTKYNDILSEQNIIPVNVDDSTITRYGKGALNTAYDWYVDPFVKLVNPNEYARIQDKVYEQSFLTGQPQSTTKNMLANQGVGAVEAALMGYGGGQAVSTVVGGTKSVYDKFKNKSTVPGSNNVKVTNNGKLPNNVNVPNKGKVPRVKGKLGKALKVWNWINKAFGAAMIPVIGSEVHNSANAWSDKNLVRRYQEGYSQDKNGNWQAPKMQKKGSENNTSKKLDTTTTQPVVNTEPQNIVSTSQTPQLTQTPQLPKTPGLTNQTQTVGKTNKKLQSKTETKTNNSFKPYTANNNTPKPNTRSSSGFADFINSPKGKQLLIWLLLGGLGTAGFGMMTGGRNLLPMLIGGGALGAGLYAAKNYLETPSRRAKLSKPSTWKYVYDDVKSNIEKYYIKNKINKWFGSKILN